MFQNSFPQSFLENTSPLLPNLFASAESVGFRKGMSAVDFDIHLFSLPDDMGKLFPSRSNETHEHKGVSGIPTDILETPNHYTFFMDVPGLSKSEIQVTVEDNNLVIRSNGKRKREDGEKKREDGDEGDCKYLRLERRSPQNLMRKFRLPENCNASAITAKCENGVLTVTIEKLPPKSKTVAVAIS